MMIRPLMHNTWCSLIWYGFAPYYAIPMRTNIYRYHGYHHACWWLWWLYGAPLILPQRSRPWFYEKRWSSTILSNVDNPSQHVEYIRWCEKVAPGTHWHLLGMAMVILDICDHSIIGCIMHCYPVSLLQKTLSQTHHHRRFYSNRRWCAITAGLSRRW